MLAVSGIVTIFIICLHFRSEWVDYVSLVEYSRGLGVVSVGSQADTVWRGSPLRAASSSVDLCVEGYGHRCWQF